MNIIDEVFSSNTPNSIYMIWKPYSKNYLVIIDVFARGRHVNVSLMTDFDALVNGKNID